MANTTYEYVSAKVASDRLRQEIDSLQTTETLAEITGVGNTIYLTFTGPLSSLEQTAVEDVVAHHSGEPLPEPLTKVDLDCQKSEDGKLVVDLFPGTEGFKTWITSQGDHETMGRGEGQPMVIEFTAEETRGEKEIEISFKEPIEIHDGQVTWSEPTAWDYRDKFSVGLRLPATVTTENPGGTGNCNKVPIGPGVHVIVPANGDGAYDVSPSDRKPVPAKGQPGYWNVTYNTGEVLPSASPGAGDYNLFDFPVTAWMVKNVCCNHPMGVFDIDVYKVEYFHPTWKLLWKCNKQSPGAGVMAAWVFCFRRETT